MPHVSPMVVLSRAFFQEHFFFFTYLSYHTTSTLSYIPHISKLTRLTSCAIKNHSGVKTCGVAETRAQQLPQIKSKELATVSRIEAYSGDPNQLYDVQENLEKKITELRSPKKWRNLENLGRLVCRILNYQRRPTSNRRCISTIPWKALHKNHRDQL